MRKIVKTVKLSNSDVNLANELIEEIGEVSNFSELVRSLLYNCHHFIEQDKVLDQINDFKKKLDYMDREVQITKKIHELSLYELAPEMRSNGTIDKINREAKLEIDRTLKKNQTRMYSRNTI